MLSGWATSEATELGTYFSAGPRFGGQVRTVVGDIKRTLARNGQVVIASRQSPRLADLFREAGLDIFPVDAIVSPPSQALTLVQGAMEEGWLLGEGLWFLTDAELFGWGRPRARKPLRPRAVSPEVFFADVSPGDFVVHIEHGIGQFQGLMRMSLDGIEREYLPPQAAPA